MMDRDCRTCIYSNFNEGDNGCTKWECEYISRSEAIEAWKFLHGQQVNEDELYTLTEEEYQNLSPMKKWWYDKYIEMWQYDKIIKPNIEETEAPIEIIKFVPIKNIGCGQK